MRPTTERRQNHHPSYPPNGPQSLPPWHAAAATVTKVWDWSGAVTQSPTSDCYAYAQGQPVRSSGLGPGSQWLHCKPEPVLGDDYLRSDCVSRYCPGACCAGAGQVDKSG